MPATKTKNYGSLGKEFGVAVGASQAGIRVNTDEIDDAMRVISGVCEKYGWELRVWDKALGLQIAGQPVNPVGKKKSGLAGIDSDACPADGPVQQLAHVALHAFLSEEPKKDEDDEEEIVPVVLVMKNYNLALEGQHHERMVAVSQHLVSEGKSKGKFIVGLMPAEAKLPPELAPLFHVIDHELPDKEELLEILSEIVDDDEQKKYTAEDLDTAAHAALGLTRLQAEGVFAAYEVQWTGSKSAATDRPTLAKYVWRHKAKILNREGLVELRETNLNYGNVGGLEGFKQFLDDLLTPDPLEEFDADVRYKGVVAVGPPGVGKSLMAYCVGNEHNMPSLLINPGNWMDQYVGNSEKNTRKGFQIVARMAPCIAIIDEVGQVMPSGKDQGSDVGKRMLGTFLTQMNDMQEPVLWFFTSNDVQDMHEAILRAERIDAQFYVRLPDRNQRAPVWALYLKKFFPAQVGGKDDPRAFQASMKKLLDGAKGNKKDVVDWFVRALLTLDEEKAEAAWEQLKAKDDTLFQAVKAAYFDDEGWTPAEIRACCRLSRRLKKTLAETAKRVGHVCLGEKGIKRLARLDAWALNVGALDAETGELFVDPDVGDDEEEKTPVKTGGKKVRRKIRRQD